MTPPRFGAFPTPTGVRFAVWSGAASRVWVSLFDDKGKREVDRVELTAGERRRLFAHMSGVSLAGVRYGFRADGDYAPERGLWFDPQKLLVDPYALELDRPFLYDARLAAPRGESEDTAALVPKAIAIELPDPLEASPPLFEPGGLIYELPVRAFSMRHPGVPKRRRGTIGALAHPAIIEHLQKLGVSRCRAHAHRGLDRRAPSAAARAHQCLGLQSGRLHGARPAPGARRAGRAPGHRFGASCCRHRRHSRPRLQSHRRERPIRPDAVAARPRQSRLLPPRAQDHRSG